MTPTTSRILGAALLAGATLALAFTIPAMVERLERHNQQADYARFAFGRIDTPSFNFAGLPVEIRDTEQRGERFIEIAWRGETHRLRASGRIDDRLPDLVKYEDWLQVYEIAELPAPPGSAAPGYAATPDADTATDPQRPTRLVITARHPPGSVVAAPGADADTWAVTARREWLYELIELRRPDDPPSQPLPEPTIDPTRRAPSVPPVSDFTTTDAFARWTFNFVALPEYQRTWHYSAALGVTPQLKYPRNKFTDDGMTAMHWTWPASGAAILAAVAGLCLLASANVRR